MDTLKLAQVRAADPQVAALIATHFELMRSTSPEESCHVMPADALDREGVYLLGAFEGGMLLGIGGIKEFAPGHGEIKSMHTSSAARGRGVARRILHGLIAYARNEGIARLSLETGSMIEFAAARALYESESFETTAPFGDYVLDPLSVFMTRSL